MKIRQGFISNSSTSSFVAVGIKIDKINDMDKITLLKTLGVDVENLDEDELENKYYDIIYDSEYMIGEEGFENYIMLRIADSGEDSSFNDNILALEDIQRVGEKIKSEFKLPQELKPLLIIGTRMC